MNARVRLLLLTETYHPEIGGGEVQARLLATALARRGSQVTIVTRRSRPEVPGEEAIAGVRVVRIPPVGRGRWKKWGLLGTTLPPVARLLRDADVALVSGYRIMGIPALTAARLRGRPCVLKADSTGEMSGEFYRAGLARVGLRPDSLPVRLLMKARNALLGRADAFIAISGEIGAELRAAGVPAARIHRIPNGVDTRRFRPASSDEQRALRLRLGLPEGRIAVYTGRLVSYKGLPLLLRVWKTIRDSGPHATLVLVGEGSSDIHNCERELREYVMTEGLEDSVIFTGGVEDVAAYLRAADVFVFPTENEAFGVSLVEAMACGLPSVATPVGGIRDFLDDGVNGILVPASEFEPLRSALQRLLAGGPHVDSLGRAARETAVRRFSEDAVADAYLRLFETLADHRPTERLR